MPSKFKIAVIIGSLRKASWNRKVANALIALDPKSLSLEIVEIGDLSFYNEDLEQSAPKAWNEFRKKIKAADAVLFITPEYNRSVPAVLKNAIDVGSRPYGQNSWEGKPGAIISVSPGRLAAFGANHHLRQSLVFINVPAMAQPEAYIGDVSELFNEKDQLTDPAAIKRFNQFLQAFTTWINTNKKQASTSV